MWRDEDAPLEHDVTTRSSGYARRIHGRIYHHLYYIQVAAVEGRRRRVAWVTQSPLGVEPLGQHARNASMNDRPLSSFYVYSFGSVTFDLSFQSLWPSRLTPSFSPAHVQTGFFSWNWTDAILREWDASVLYCEWVVRVQVMVVQWQDSIQHLSGY